jgi:hypothetical protein
MLGKRSPRDNDIPQVPIYRLTIAQLKKMVEIGILHGDDRVELWDGWLVSKYSQSVAHSYAAMVLQGRFHRMLGEEWWVRIRAAVICKQSLLEPDLAVIRDHPRYGKHWPHAKGFEFAIEISDAELSRDQNYKLPIYAAAGMPKLLIVNLIDRRVEVYSNPHGGKKPNYKQRVDYGPSESVSIEVGGDKVGIIRVSSLLP